ncbi:MAG: DeoR/GlpR family DNA-binding transcription regulator [Capsulimonadaceae bacterium]
MLVMERRREIVSLIERERSVRVTSLARLFDVTQETIRRDLEQLEMEGKLVRSHGGAVTRLGGVETPQSDREAHCMAEKVAIAREAVRHVNDGDTILIDASTTALHMARVLPDIPITVITNSIQVCVELSNRPRVRAVSTGGVLSVATLSFVGPRAEQMLTEYHVDRFFFSCTAIDLEYGLSDVSEAEAVLKRRMMSVADRTYLLVDKSKFGVKAFKRFAGVDEVDVIVTNDTLDPSIMDMLVAQDVQVLLGHSRD